MPRSITGNAGSNKTGSQGDEPTREVAFMHLTRNGRSEAQAVVLKESR